MKPCRYAQGHTSAHPQIGGEPLIVRQENCALKMQSSLKQLEVYQALFEKGLEGSMVSNICPIAASGNWKDCPFYRP